MPQCLDSERHSHLLSPVLFSRLIRVVTHTHFNGCFIHLESDTWVGCKYKSSSCRIPQMSSLQFKCRRRNFAKNFFEGVKIKKKYSLHPFFLFIYTKNWNPILKSFSASKSILQKFQKSNKKALSRLLLKTKYQEFFGIINKRLRNILGINKSSVLTFGNQINRLPPVKEKVIFKEK